MNTCFACGIFSPFAININAAIEGTRVRDLVGLYLHLETAPGNLISNFLCQQCTKTLMDCHRIKKHAEGLNLPSVMDHGNLTPFAAIYPHNESFPDVDESSMIYYRSFSYQGDLEHPSYESETYERSSNSSLDTFRDPENIRYNQFRNNIHNSSTASDLKQKEREPDHQPRTFTDAVKTTIEKDLKHELESNESASSLAIMDEPLDQQNEEDDTLEDEEDVGFNRLNITSDLFFIRLGD